MQTILTTDPAEAAAFIRSGGIVAFPTETVYGLGADVFNESAIARVFEAKNRPADNPLIAHIAELSQFHLLTTEIPEFARKLIERFFPGPLTVVLRKRREVPNIATASLGSIGIRMPGNDLAQSFLGSCGAPVVAPSANLSGRPSPTTWQAVHEDLDGRIDCILQGGATEIGIESTVVDCTGSQPIILREGSVSHTDIKAVVGEIAEIGPVDAGVPKSPGMKHKHYSPRARVVLTSPVRRIEGGAAYIGLRAPADADDNAFVLVSGSLEDYAHDVYEFFRECDRRGIDTIYCETVNETGIGRALMDRLRRAAED